MLCYNRIIKNRGQRTKDKGQGEQGNDSCRNGIKNNELWRNKNTL